MDEIVELLLNDFFLQQKKKKRFLKHFISLPLYF